MRGEKAPYAGNALKMPIVPSPATFYDREKITGSLFDCFE
jgi:hypothetical protein